MHPKKCTGAIVVTLAMLQRVINCRFIIIIIILDTAKHASIIRSNLLSHTTFIHQRTEVKTLSPTGWRKNLAQMFVRLITLSNNGQFSNLSLSESVENVQ